MDIHPFRIDVDDTVLDDLRERLTMTRLPGATGLATRELDPDWLDGLCAWWQHDYDWRAQEARLNRFHHYRTHIDGTGIHFIHERGNGESTIPLLLVHGWPDSFARFLDIIPLLTAPAANGLPSFDVVVPSLPGYGWSDRLRDDGHIDQVPAAFALFPKDLSTPPREWAERWFDVRRWSPMPRGGHFAAMEQPQLLADDLRAAFAQVR